MLDGHWFSIRDGDPRGRALFLRHYSSTLKRRQPVRPIGNGERFSGPGEKLVLLTLDALALFVWRRERYRLDKQEGINCAVFRNEGAVLSSELIREADALADRRWPDSPRHFTYVSPQHIRSTNPGYCFLRAGWRRCSSAQQRRVLLERVGGC